MLPLPRFRRDVLEGTLEEMLEEVEVVEESHKEKGNSTVSRQRRQA